MAARSFFRNRKSSAWLIGGTLLLLAVLLILIPTPRQPQPYPPYLTGSPSPTGLKAFHTYLKNHHPQVSLWKSPVQSLPASETNQFMLSVEPPLLDARESAAWEEWLAAGNTLWLLHSDPGGIFGLETAAAAEPAQDTARTVSGQNEFQGDFQAVVRTEVRLLPEPEDRILLEDTSGVLAVSRPYGNGELRVLLCPQWLTNESILENDHLDLILPFIAQDKPAVIWFNEYHHGYRSAGALFAPYPAWYLILLLQGGLALAFWLWSRGKRFGPVRIPREETVRLGDERIRALAAWYERGKFYKESLLIQEEYLYQTLRERWGISAQAEDAEYQAKAQRYLKKDAVALWLQNWQLKKELKLLPKISAKEYLQWTNRLTMMQREVEHR